MRRRIAGAVLALGLAGGATAPAVVAVAAPAASATVVAAPSDATHFHD
jgi:hypothetical protein